MDDSSRLRLIRDVYATLLHEAGSFAEIGADVAHLLGAITMGDVFSREAASPAFRAMLTTAVFDSSHVVWDFIE